jgi:hypothetical protein
MNNVKKKLFTFGGCDILDIAHDQLLASEFDLVPYNPKLGDAKIDSLNFELSPVPSKGTSLMSLYTAPGPAAHRLLDTLMHSPKRETALNKELYSEICKFPYFKFWKENAGPNDYLLLGFSAELYTKYYTTSECFTLIHTDGLLKIQDTRHCLHWLYKEYIQKEQHLLSFDEQVSLNCTSDLTVDFARDIYEIFQDRVFVVKTHFGSLIKSDNNLKELNVTPANLVYYKQTKVMDSPFMTYAERCAGIILNQFVRRYPTELKPIKLSDKHIFLDPGHKWGISPWHIADDSRSKIANLILMELWKKSFKDNKLKN